MTRSRQTADWGSRAGLAKIVPSSVAVGSGTGSANALGTVTFSGCSTLSLNGVFSATYNNYLAVINIDSITASNIMYMRMRVSGADSSASSYQYAGDNTPGGYDQWTQAVYGTTAFVWQRYGSGGVTSNMNFYYPFATSNTGFNSISNALSVDARKNTSGGYFNATTSFDGFTIYSASGTMNSGTISMYGYTN
jgi:hypothetical protein